MWATTTALARNSRKAPNIGPQDRCRAYRKRILDISQQCLPGAMIPWAAHSSIRCFSCAPHRQRAAIRERHLPIGELLHQLRAHAAVGRVLEQIVHLVRIVLEVIELAPGIAMVDGHAPALGDNGAQARRRRMTENGTLLVVLDHDGAARETALSADRRQ